DTGEYRESVRAPLPRTARKGNASPAVGFRTGANLAMLRSHAAGGAKVSTCSNLRQSAVHYRLVGMAAGGQAMPLVMPRPAGPGSAWGGRAPVRSAPCRARAGTCGRDLVMSCAWIQGRHR